jgi:murein hydrolase activator
VRFVIRFIGFLFALSAWEPIFAQDAPAAPDSGAELRSRLGALRAEINAVKAVIAAKNKEQSQAQNELRRAELAIAESAKAVIQINGELSTTQAELDALTAQAQTLSAKLLSERDTLARLLRSAYAIGQLEQVKLALSQAKVARIGRVLAYHTYVNQVRVQAISNIQASLAALKAIELQIDSKQLIAVLSQEALRSAELKDRRAERASLLQRLAAELNVGGARVQALDADIDQLNDLLSRLSDLLADVPRTLPNLHALRDLRGKMPWPVAGKIVREFGALQEGARPATGVLIATGANKSVQAVAGGRVAFSDWLRGFGMLLILDHGDGYLSLYGQCETLLHTEGEWLTAGTTLATAGTDPIHFELRKDGQPIDPARWLARE